MVLLQLLRNTVFLPVLLHIFLTVAEHWAYVSFSSSLDRSIWCTLQGFHGLWCVSQTPVTAHVQTQTSKKLKQVSLKHNKCQSSFTLQPEQGQLCLFSGNSLSDCNTNTFEGVHLKTWTSVFAWGCLPLSVVSFRLNSVSDMRKFPQGFQLSAEQLHQLKADSAPS